MPAAYTWSPRTARLLPGNLLLTTFLVPRRGADQWPGHRDCDNNLLELSETEAGSLCHTRDVSSPLTLLTTCSTPSPVSPLPPSSPDMDLIKVSPMTHPISASSCVTLSGSNQTPFGGKAL